MSGEKSSGWKGHLHHKHKVITHPLSGADVISIFLRLSAAAKTNLDLSDSGSRPVHIKL